MFCRLEHRASGGKSARLPGVGLSKAVPGLWWTDGLGGEVESVQWPRLYSFQRRVAVPWLVALILSCQREETRLEKGSIEGECVTLKLTWCRPALSTGLEIKQLFFPMSPFLLRFVFSIPPLEQSLVPFFVGHWLGVPGMCSLARSVHLLKLARQILTPSRARHLLRRPHTARPWYMHSSSLGPRHGKTASKVHVAAGPGGQSSA